MLYNITSATPLLFQAVAHVLKPAEQSPLTRLSRGHLRTTTSDRRGESMPCLSTSSLIKEPLFTSGSVYDKESSQVHIFSPRRGGSFSSSKPSPHRHSPHRNAVPEAKVLTGVAQWEGNQTRPFFFNGLARRQGGPLTYQSLIRITPFQLRKEGSRNCPFIIF